MRSDLYKKLVEKFKQHLVIEDFEPLEVVIATYIANHFCSDPLWLFVIAPSSSAKTEFILALSGMGDVHFLSDLTDKTLASGFKVGEHSLLHRLNKKIVCMKDFTTVLSMRVERQSEILAQLREIYDGKFDKEWGNGAKINWKGKIGFIAGVTPAIDQTYATYQALGERFVQIRMEAVEEMPCAKKAMENLERESTHRQDISELMKNLLNDLLNNLTMPKIDDAAYDRLAAVATICVRARTAIKRDRYTREFDYVPEPEAPPRFAKQLALLACGLTVLRGRQAVNGDDFKTVCRVAFDCLPRTRARLLKLLIDDKQKKLTAAKAIEITKLSKSSVYRLLEELVALDLLKKEGRESAEEWSLSDLVLKCLKYLEFPQYQM